MNESDIEIVTGSEFCATGVKGLTEAGTLLVDNFLPVLLVPDSGRIVIADDEVDRFRARAREAGLAISETKATV